MAQPRSIAERCRAHRAEMELAMKLGITPKQAREELDRRDARQRWTQNNQRLAAKAAGCTLPSSAAEPEEPALPWWQRD